MLPKELATKLKEFQCNVRNVNSLFSALGTDKDTPFSRKELERICEDTQQLENTIISSLEVKTQYYDESSEIGALISQFMQTRSAWQVLYEDSKQIAPAKVTSSSKKIEVIQPNEKTVGNLQRSTTEDDEPTSDTPWKGDTKLIARDTKQYDSQHQVLEELAAERTAKIAEIKEDLVEIAELTKATLELTKESSSKLNSIETSVSTAEKESKEGVTKIAQAANLEANVSTNNTYTFLGSVAVGATVGTVLLGPLGTFVGATTGLMLGNKVNNSVSQFKKETVEKEILEHHLRTSNKWVDDEDATVCQLCRKSFGYLNRRHHCRNCGGVFCEGCSSKKLPIKIPGMEVEKPARACEVCYSNYWLS